MVSQSRSRRRKRNRGGEEEEEEEKEGNREGKERRRRGAGPRRHPGLGEKRENGGHGAVAGQVVHFGIRPPGRVLRLVCDGHAAGASFRWRRSGCSRKQGRKPPSWLSASFIEELGLDGCVSVC